MNKKDIKEKLITEYPEAFIMNTTTPEELAQEDLGDPVNEVTFNITDEEFDKCKTEVFRRIQEIDVSNQKS